MVNLFIVTCIAEIHDARCSFLQLIDVKVSIVFQHKVFPNIFLYIDRGPFNLTLSFFSISQSLDKAISPSDFDSCNELVKDISFRCASFDSINDLSEPLLDLFATDLNDYAFADLLSDSLEYSEVLDNLSN